MEHFYPTTLSEDTGPNVSPSEIQATQSESQSQTQSSSVEELQPESSQRKDGNTNSTSDFGVTSLQHAAPLHKAAQIGLTVEMVDDLSFPELKFFLQYVNLSISGKGAGTGCLMRLLKSRLKQFLLSNNRTGRFKHCQRSRHIC